MLNVQSRHVPAPASSTGALLTLLAEPRAGVWPVHSWPPLVLDDGLRPGSSGGHGPIRYRVVEHEPGRRTAFEFLGRGLRGHHAFVVTDDGPDGSRVTHTIDATTHGAMRLAWPLSVRWLHEALVADLLDDLELTLTGRPPARPARWSPWVRLLRAVLGRLRGRGRSRT